VILEYRLVLRAALLMAATALSGCLGDDTDPAPSTPPGTLNVYMSLPSHGLTADEARAVDAGARLALDERGGRAGRFRIRLLRMDSALPGRQIWDPGLVQANAERAAKDPRAIAYLGELGLGASAVSLPVTNDADLLQVSPYDTLTSLTRTPPGRAGRGAPDRYYPTGRRSFVRLAPSDLDEVDALVERMRTLGVGRVSLVSGEGVYAVEFASQLAQRARRAGTRVVSSAALGPEPGAARAIASELRAIGPDAIAYAGAGDRRAVALLSALSERMPETPVLGSSALIARRPLRYPAAPAVVETVGSVLPAAEYPAAAGRLLERLRRTSGAAAARPEALYGYESMRLVLDAISEGRGRRRAVAASALGAGERRSPMGPYEVRPTGDVTGPPLMSMRLSNGRFVPARGAP